MTQSSKPPLSRFRLAGGLIFTSGQLPRGDDGEIVPGDIQIQTRQALANLANVLEEAGSGLSDVIKVTVWLTDTVHMAGFNEVYRQHFSESYPARTTVVSGLVAGDIEIEAVAFLGS
jgi:reactive intermediate/imine deaminase